MNKALRMRLQYHDDDHHDHRPQTCVVDQFVSHRFLDVELVTFFFSLQVWEPDVCKSATSMALEAGFRFIWSSTLATWCRKSIYQGPTVTSG